MIFYGISAWGYNLRQISSKENLSNNSIISLAQDKRGLLWIGTCDGLNVYTGKNVFHYHSSNKKEVLSGNLIDKITETEDGILWIQTYYGIDKVDIKKDSIDRFNDFNKVLFTKKDKNNNFYIINKDSCIYYFNRKQNNFIKKSLPLIRFNDIIGFSIDKNNIISIFNRSGNTLTYFINTENDSIDFQEIIGYKHTTGILYSFDAEDEIYFVDEDCKLYEFNIRDQKALFIADIRYLIQQNGKIASIVKFHDDYFIGFKTNGLFILRKNSSRYTIEKALLNSGIFCLLKDRYQDILWIGTDGKGVYAYSEELYSIGSTRLNDFTFKLNKPVRALFREADNTLWIGTKGDGIAKIQDYDISKDILQCKIEYISSSNSDLWDNSVYCFLESKKDIVWIGTEEGLNYYSKKDKVIRKAVLSDHERRIKYIHDIYEQDSILWIASVSMGIIKAEVKWEKDRPEISIQKHFTVRKGDISSNYFFSFHPENDSTIGVTNRGAGLFRIHTKSMELENIRFNDNTLDEIYSIYKDRSGDYLIATGAGLLKYKSINNYEVMNIAAGFPTNLIHCILPEQDGTYWLSTNNGLINYNIRDNSFREFGYRDGLRVLEFSDGASFYDPKSNVLFFGGTDGFVTISKNKNYHEQEYMPPLYFDRLTVLGKEQNSTRFLSYKIDSKPVILNYDQNFFSVSFLVIDYLNNTNYDYLYKLEGINEEWINNGASNSVPLTNFDPGEYTLLVKYRNKTLNKESPVYSIKIKILPPFYKSRLAYTIYILVFILLTGIAIRLAFIRYRKKKLWDLQLLEQKHKEEVYESKLRFFTNIAHEFCTPLTLIYGPCDRILEQKNTDKTIIKYAGVIRQNAERLNTLIQDLIEFRTIETGYKKAKVEPINITELLLRITDAFTGLVESKNVNFKKEIPEEISWNSDKDFLITILSNLLSNAFKYTSANGEVGISVSSSQEFLSIAVSNSGEGIKEEDISKMFDRYSILDNFENRDHSSWTKNGLGPAISYGMVTLLGGTIDIQSVPDEQTRFTVNLPPLVADSQASPSHERVPINIPNRQAETLSLPEFEPENYDELKSTVLVIDDEPEIVWLLKEILMNEFNVITTKNTSQAVSVLKEGHPDVILCDVMIPGMDGISFTKQLKSTPETAHIPVVLISAKNEIEKQIEGMEAGAELYVTKPFNADYLKTSLKQVITRKETLKDYFKSPQSAFELEYGKLTHKEDKKFIKEVLEIINTNIQNKELSASFIASKLNMSSRNLYRKMNELKETGIAEIIRERRLHIARDLLTHSTLTVDEIVFKSGFSNRVSFFKAFSKKFGCTPKKYRNQYKIQ